MQGYRHAIQFAGTRGATLHSFLLWDDTKVKLAEYINVTTELHWASGKAAEKGVRA